MRPLAPLFGLPVSSGTPHAAMLTTLQSLQSFIRFNQWQTDPLSNNSAGWSVAARYDLILPGVCIDSAACFFCCLLSAHACTACVLGWQCAARYGRFVHCRNCAPVVPWGLAGGPQWCQRGWRNGRKGHLPRRCPCRDCALYLRANHPGPGALHMVHKCVAYDTPPRPPRHVQLHVANVWATDVGSTCKLQLPPPSPPLAPSSHPAIATPLLPAALMRDRLNPQSLQLQQL